MARGHRNERAELDCYTLKYLFHHMFRAEEGGGPVVGGYRRLKREDYLRMFFPQALYEAYAASLPQITWFFNGDEKNKGVRLALIDMLRRDMDAVIAEMQQRCREVLWPAGQHPAFDRARLYRLLCSVKFNIRQSQTDWRILPAQDAARPSSDPAGDADDCCLSAFFEADVTAALARVILTLAVAYDAEDAMIGRIWSAAQENDATPAEDMTPEGLYRWGRMIYLDGQHERAFAVFEQAAQALKRPAETVVESKLYCQLAQMLLLGDGHYRDQAEAVRWLELAQLEAYPQSIYLLAHNSSRTLALLEKAAAYGHVKAMCEAGNAWFYGSEHLGCTPDRERAARYFGAGMGECSSDGAHCAFMMGRIWQEKGDYEQAALAYRIAQEQGHEEACEQLAQMRMLSPDVTPEPETAAGRGKGMMLCLMNGCTGYNASFRSSLPAACRVYADASVAEKLREWIGDCLQEAETALPETVIALLSADQEDNLAQAVETLSVLNALALRCPERQHELAEKVQVFVMAEQSHAGMILDAAYAGISGHFRLRLCDPGTDAVETLLSSAPLFLPCIGTEAAGTVRVVVIGSSGTAAAALKKVIALPLPPEHPVELHAITPCAEEMEAAFDADCPGVASAPPTIRRSIPRFHPCRISAGSMNRLIRDAWTRLTDGAQHAEDAELTVGECLLTGNYYIVATDDDALNLQLGALLRRLLLKLDPTFSRRPFIAVLANSPVIRQLTGSAAANPELRSFNPQNQYGLYSFGAAERYTWQGFRNDVLEKRAQAIHLHYSGQPVTAEECFRAMSAYYRRQYNRASSRAMALGLSYRMFACGFALERWPLYGMREQECALAHRFSQWLQEEEHLEYAASVEHDRWNCCLLADGWESATPLQTETYVRQGVGGHQHHLAKLHPFIAPWKDIQEGTLQREVARAVQIRFPNRQVYDPQAADREAVLITEEILRVY
ncbi:MAG: sel1 repeat family protein [Clostridia bacterium]|nr:sel1 repeat family protein [Clostridia bacterium]